MIYSNNTNHVRTQLMSSSVWFWPRIRYIEFGGPRWLDLPAMASPFSKKYLIISIYQNNSSSLHRTKLIMMLSKHSKVPMFFFPYSKSVG